MYYNLSKEMDKERFKNRANHLYGKGAKVELVERRPKASRSQKNYMHLLFGWYGHETGYPVEEVKQGIFKRIVCKEFFEYEKDGMLFYLSTEDEKIDTLTLTLAIEKFRNHAASDLGIPLPEPNEKEKLQGMEDKLREYGIAQYL